MKTFKDFMSDQIDDMKKELGWMKKVIRVIVRLWLVFIILYDWGKACDWQKTDARMTETYCLLTLTACAMASVYWLFEKKDI